MSFVLVFPHHPPAADTDTVSGSVVANYMGAVPIPPGTDWNGLLALAQQNKPTPVSAAGDLESWTASRFVPIDQFCPANRMEQEGTVAVTGFPATALAAVTERVLETVATGRFTWSAVDDEWLSSGVVYLRMELVAEVGPTIARFRQVEGCKAHSSSEAHIDSEVEVPPVDRSAVSLLFAIPRRTAAVINASTYNISDADLVDVPPAFRTEVVDHIVRFRTRALQLETDQRRATAARERQLAQERVSLLLTGEEAEVISSDSSEEENDSDIDEGTDYRQLAARLKELEMYPALVAQRQRGEAARVAAYRRGFNHSVYSRQRGRERAEEEERDSHDRDEAQQEEQTATDKQAVQKADPAPDQEVVAETEAGPVIDVDAVAALELGWPGVRASIDAWVAEYLGEPEAELLEFILGFAKTRGSVKSELVAELEDVLEEEAAELVERLWAMLEQVSAQLRAGA